MMGDPKRLSASGGLGRALLKSAREPAPDDAQREALWGLLAGLPTSGAQGPAQSQMGALGTAGLAKGAFVFAALAAVAWVVSTHSSGNSSGAVSRPNPPGQEVSALPQVMLPQVTPGPWRPVEVPPVSVTEAVADVSPAPPAPKLSPRRQSAPASSAARSD